jgi:hypothetical protein
MLKISLKDYKRFLKILRNLLDIYGYLSINDVKKIAIHYAFTNIDEDTIKQTFKLLAKKNGATLIDAKYIFSREVKECYKIFKSIEHLLIPFDQFIADSIKRMDELLINIPNYLILEESKELLLYSNTKLKT